MKNSEVIDKFLDKEFNKCASSVSSKQDKLFSYNTIIAQWFGDILLVNDTRYSSTTSKIQGILIRSINSNIKWYTVDHIPMGTNDLNYIYNGQHNKV